MSSPEWRTQQLVIAAKRQQVKAWDSRLGGPGLNEATRRHCLASINALQRVIAADEAATTQLEELAVRCLHIALKNYGRALHAGGSHDLAAVYRLCQLWLALSEDAGVNRAVKAVVEGVPSAKFVPLVYQIASRMSARAASGLQGDSQKAFQHVLCRALERMALDHPYHALFSLIALRNGNLGRNGQPVPSGAVTGALARQEFDLDKVQAASALLARLARDPRRGELQRQMEAMVTCFVELAAAQFGPKGGSNAPPPDGWAFPAAIKRRLQSLPLVPIPTAPLPLDPSGAYGHVPTLAELGSRLGHAGGINAPKVLQATDSDGVSHRMLVKSGNDDMRQDAVMQQFFGLINTLLAATPDAAARRLGMGTYKVVPISPAAGLVQWVEDTVPMADYLAGRNRQSGAHARYRGRGAWTWFDCYNRMNKAPADQLLPSFHECLHKFPPVFHHFFLEAFRAPAAWFEARTRYTRSIAVSSMAGYVIGLGDRHLGNMLLDKGSAAVLQIDLGVAFEQGMFLNTPETVPFRLTRDVVDGMGAFGVEGPMRRCCEETLRVLRRNKEALLTVVQVVLHDPLYRWRMSPVKAQRRQQELSAGDGASGGSEGDGTGGGEGPSQALGNADAARAVLRVKQKLEGVAGGEGEPLGVAAQVDALLAEAQDAEKLCRMFVGWSAWM
ncbi:MAG: kinase-like domain-containing protein [Monoraphidium minutum]|nr:MAG: kinase-like domain-containing protein [Monoraphidium minutum]